VVDTTALTLAHEIPGTEGVHGVALAPDKHVGLTSNGGSSSVTVFDLDSLQTLARIGAVGQGPDAIVYDKRSSRAFTFNGRSRDASVIDVGRLRVVGSVPLPGKPEFAVSDEAGSVFVNIQDRNLLARIDTASLQVTAQWPLPGCEGPTGLAVDVAQRRLFVSCSNRTLLVVDARSGAAVARLEIGAGSDAVAFDPGKALVLSSNRDGTLAVVLQLEADHYVSRPALPTLVGARTLALDPLTHRVYLVTADFEPAADASSAASWAAPVRPLARAGTFSVLSVDLAGYPDR
ncbi:MAG: YncE family protein, partial [Pseudomonadota bacterium]|nr:YncE family protein [Pseudomonadota bacterium]